jgi:hypothetical protein
MKSLKAKQTKLLLRVATCILAALTTSGCATNQPGFVYADTKSPIMALDSFPWNSGTACKWQFLGVVSAGDASIRTAMKNGRLGRVAVVDQEITGILGIYKVCTVVYGPYGDLGPPDEAAKINSLSTDEAGAKVDR